MTLGLPKAKRLRTIFACLSLFGSLFVLFAFSGINEHFGLQNVMKKDEFRSDDRGPHTSPDTQTLANLQGTETTGKAGVSSPVALTKAIVTSKLTTRAIVTTQQTTRTTTMTTKSSTTTSTTTTTTTTPKNTAPIPDADGVVRSLARCPSVPIGLVGDKLNETIDIEHVNNMTFDEVAKANPKLEEGGRYRPRGCQARHKVAIIIPMRGMESLLPGLLSHMHPIWQRQQIDYTVYVVTQGGNELFNKGKLMNIGFMEARKDRTFDCFVFHDADLILENDRCLYWCASEYAKSSSQVMHIAKHINKFNYRLLQYHPRCSPSKFRRDGKIAYFGGITSFSSEQFININGFSNIYWGWGGEDDDAAFRVEKKGHFVRRFAECQFRMFKHEHVVNGSNPLARRMINNAIDRQSIDGISSLKYRVLSTTTHPLFTNITVDVGKPSSKLLKLMADPKSANSCNGSIFMNPDMW